MKSHVMNESHRADEAERKDDGRPLRMNWFIALVVLWIVIWMFVGASGLMPRWLWATILGLLVIAGFAIALFGPRDRSSRKR
ncbi:MAG TPA: hypothetical protein VJZ26_15765 [Blastocatellia bacterium]|nr:hypothetical protein [Blastocatellia bacterium]